MYCGQEVAVKGDRELRLAVTLFCRAWTCPECEPKRRRALIARGHDGEPDLFITLTIRRIAGRSPEQAAALLAETWREVRRRALLEHKRDPSKKPRPLGPEPEKGWPLDRHGRVPRQCKLYQDKLPFGAVIEAHVSGYPHLHIMARGRWIDQAWLSAQCQELINSHRVHVRRIDKRSQAVGYVAKYCGKCAHRFGTCKRYWFSQDWKLRERRKRPFYPDIPGGWERQPGSINRFVADWKTLGWLVERIDAWTAIARKPP